MWREFARKPQMSQAAAQSADCRNLKSNTSTAFKTLHFSKQVPNKTLKAHPPQVNAGK